MREDERNFQGKKYILIVFSVIILVFLATNLYALYFKYQREEEYNAAILLFEKAQYEEAKDAFSSIGNYKESLDYYIKSLQYIKYNEAQRLFDDKKYQEAADIYFPWAVSRKVYQRRKRLYISLPWTYMIREAMKKHLQFFSNCRGMRVVIFT